LPHFKVLEGWKIEKLEGWRVGKLKAEGWFRLTSIPPFSHSSILPFFQIYTHRGLKTLVPFNLANGTRFFKMKQVGYLKM
jgi:hypothetical protein